MKNKKATNVWTVWGIIFIAVILLFFLSISIYKEFSKKKQVQKDIDALKEQAEKIKQENMTLEERIAYLSSQDYQKVQARDKLDLQDPEENVVIIAQDSVSLNQDKEEESEDKKNEIQENYSDKETSNFSKWWDYFFKN